MRYFLFFSILLFTSCSVSSYKDLKPSDTTTSNWNTQSLQTSFDKVLYQAQVYGKMPLGKRFNLSGLLFFKTLEDSSLRVVFQNQMGISFFDFGWDTKGNFTVYQIMEQMNKPALIKTLRKDFELLLFKNLSNQPIGVFENKQQHTYLKYNLTKGFVYYIYDKDQIIGIENADERRKVVVFELIQANAKNPLATQIKINHLRANFKIDLYQLIQEENETSNGTTED